MFTRRTALAVGLGTCAASTSALGQSNELITFPQMQSDYVDARNVHVWLPPGYHTSTKRYPVIYMHDGQNAFSPAFAFRGQAWEIDAALTERSRNNGRGAAIVVGIWNTPKRAADYSPTALQALLPTPLQDRIMGEIGGISLGDRYLRFIVQELKPFIDRTFRTHSSARATITMGASRGGMISLYALCEYPQIFGAAACLSTHWPMSNVYSPAANHVVDIPATGAALTAYVRAKLPRRSGHKIWMDHGTINLDSYYAPYQAFVDIAFTAQGWRKGDDFESRVYVGADHNEMAWRTRLSDPLDFLLSRL